MEQAAREPNPVQLPHPFIKLPFHFDASILAEEVKHMPPAAWMPHASGLAGNSAVALISQGGGDNNEFAGQMGVTPHLQGAPYTRQVMASWGEVLARSRFMKLEAGSEVSEHVDFNYHWHSRVRIHIPVITNPMVSFYCGDEQLNMRQGESWIFDSWRRHRVLNESDEDRVHLVIDLAGSSRFWKMVRRAQQAKVSTNTPGSLLDWKPDEHPPLRYEKFNIAPVMSPGELEALVGDLVRDFESAKTNPSELVASYRNLLEDFARDWRELWSLYGPGKDGWAHYQGLIDSLRGRLHPKRRALVTASNDLGVNPIIVQRILNAALAPDQYQAFNEQ